MTSIAIVGCGSAKLETDEIETWIPLKNLYTSNYFQKKREYAEIVTDRWFILSAKHGLVDPNHPVTESYDKHLNDLTERETFEWAIDLGYNLRVAIQRNEPIEVHLLLGQEYRAMIEDALKDKLRGYNPVVNPFQGTSGIGEQMQAINRAIQEHLGTDQATLQEAAGR